MKFPLSILALAGALVGAPPALAADPVTFRLAISNGQFVPKELRLPEGAKVKLLIRNDDGLPAEFESYDLSREIVVPQHAQVTTYVGPLKPGRYRFFNDFNPAMQGEVLVDQSPK